MNGLREELDEIRKTCFTPREKEKVWEWIQENCKLLPESSAKFKRSKNDRLDQASMLHQVGCKGPERITG